MDEFPKTRIFGRDLHKSELYKTNNSLCISIKFMFSAFNNEIWVMLFSNMFIKTISEHVY